MLFYLQISPLINDPIFRLQTDGTWRRVEHLEPLKPSDYTTPNPNDIVGLRRSNQRLKIDEKEWNVDFTRSSALDRMTELYYTAYLSRSRNVPVPCFDQLMEVISSGDDHRGNRLVMNVNGLFELRFTDEDGRTFKDPSVVVRHESFQARGGYVGKKAGRDVRFYLPWYADSLEAWLHHLKTGQCNVYSNSHTDAKLVDLEKELGIPSFRSVVEVPAPPVNDVKGDKPKTSSVATPVIDTRQVAVQKRKRKPASRGRTKVVSVTRIFGAWKLTKRLGSGGNGEVWRCENEKGQVGALKLLKIIKSKRYARFRAEVQVMERNADIPGILPIIDKSLPDSPTEGIPYYVMPVAQTMEASANGKTLEQKLDIILEVSRCLSQLHKRDITHRDIKPSNILFIEGQYYLADFGLADFPEKERVSDPHEEIGAKWTIAPEMRRISDTADPKKGDVYSLAKTLWILLTGHRKGFDGQYTVDSIIELKRFYRDSYTEPIDGLLARCTDIDPKQRPSIDEVIQGLIEWKSLVRDFHSQNRRQWLTMQNKLFPGSLPQSASWERLEDILYVLQAVSGDEALNHLFFPTGGGLDLVGVKLSHEPGCLELDLIRPNIVKPKRLLFESFGSDPEWNYFYLELDNLERATIVDDDGISPSDDTNEELSELSPLAYYPFSVLNYREDYEDMYYIPEEARLIRRWLKGNMVIFCKRSTYNLNSGTYDGRHNQMSVDQFRAYIGRNVRHYERTRALEQQAAERSSSEVKANQQPRDHRIYEIPIYRCGYCGNIVDDDGKELDEETRKNHIIVYEIYGGSLTTCNSCSIRLEAETRAARKIG